MKSLFRFHSSLVDVYKRQVVDSLRIRRGIMTVTVTAIRPPANAAIWMIALPAFIRIAVAAPTHAPEDLSLIHI